MKKWLSTRNIVLFFVGLVALVAALIFVPRINWTLNLLLIIFGVLFFVLTPLMFIGYYRALVRDKRIERKPEKYELTKQPQNQWITDRKYRRSCFMLHKTGSQTSSKDATVILATRQTKWLAIFACMPAIIGGVVILLIIGVLILAVPSDVNVFDAHYHLPDNLVWGIRGVLAVIALLLELAAAVYCLIAVIDWWSWFLYLTDEYLIQARIPPAIFPWMKDALEALPLVYVYTVNEDPGRLGNFLHYGNMAVTTLQQTEDDSMWRMSKIPYMPDVALMVRDAAAACKERVSAQAVSDPEASELLRELIAIEQATGKSLTEVLRAVAGTRRPPVPADSQLTETFPPIKDPILQPQPASTVSAQPVHRTVSEEEAQADQSDPPPAA